MQEPISQPIRAATLKAEIKSTGKEVGKVEQAKAKVKKWSKEGKKVLSGLMTKTEGKPREALAVIGGGGLQEEKLTQEVISETKPKEDSSKTVTHSQTPDISPLEQVKKELFDQKTISKKHDQEGREALASDIRAIRNDLENLKKEGTKTEEKIGERQGKLLVRLKQKLNKPDQQTIQLQEKLLETQAKREGLPNPRKMLEAYYEKMATEPLTNQEKRELLKPKVLSNLSTEEYITLWRRLNPHFLTHVTRQGFRDHTGGDVMVDHTSGYREFINGFVDVMGNGRSIFSPIARIGLVNRDETTVKSFVSNFLQDISNPVEAKEMFLNFLNRHLASAPKYPDITATHLAAQMVSDGYYGGERGNEVFFVYPSDVLASQYAFAFNGWEKDFTKAQSEVKWNDVFIWTDPNHPGVPVDSGIVFLAEKVPVDPETGSKYASEIKVVDGQEKRVTIEDAALVNTFVEWGKKLDDQSPLKKAFTSYKEERNYYDQQYLKESCFAAFVRELQGLGFETDSSAALASNIIGDMFWKDSFDGEALRGIIESSNAHLKRAENTIPAKQYWENYFTKNPELRPKHIQYYDGNPTNAVLKFQQENNIGRADTSKTDGQLLGFDDHHVLDMGKDPRANAGYDELVETANKIITERFNQIT